MNYPKAIKAFYMRVNDDGWMVAAMDVLAPGIGEIIGGSQREEQLRGARCAHGRARHRPGALRLVLRSAPLRHGAARRLRPRQRARRNPLSGALTPPDEGRPNSGLIVVRA